MILINYTQMILLHRDYIEILRLLFKLHDWKEFNSLNLISKYWENWKNVKKSYYSQGYFQIWRSILEYSTDHADHLHRKFM